MDTVAMRWSKVIPAYRRHHEKVKAGRRARTRTADDWWAWEAVSHAAQTGTLPLTVLDALISDPDGDSDYRVYVGAGPLEDLLRSHPDSYAEAVAERAPTSAAWAEALTGVWLHHAEWTALAPQLRPWISEPLDEGIRPSKGRGRRRAGRRSAPLGHRTLG